MSDELENRRDAAIRAVNDLFGLVCNEREQIEALEEVRSNIDDYIQVLKEQENKN